MSGCLRVFAPSTRPSARPMRRLPEVVTALGGWLWLKLGHRSPGYARRCIAALCSCAPIPPPSDRATDRSHTTRLCSPSGGSVRCHTLPTRLKPQRRSWLALPETACRRRRRSFGVHLRRVLEPYRALRASATVLFTRPPGLTAGRVGAKCLCVAGRPSDLREVRAASGPKRALRSDRVDSGRTEQHVGRRCLTTTDCAGSSR